MNTPTVHRNGMLIYSMGTCNFLDNFEKFKTNFLPQSSTLKSHILHIIIANWKPRTTQKRDLFKCTSVNFNPNDYNFCHPYHRGKCFISWIYKITPWGCIKPIPRNNSIIVPNLWHPVLSNLNESKKKEKSPPTRVRSICVTSAQQVGTLLRRRRRDYLKRIMFSSIRIKLLR